MLILDVGSLVKKYPDISQDHLSCLLNLRGDLKANEIKEMVDDSISKEPISDLKARSIFSKVKLSTSKNAMEHVSSLNPFENAPSLNNPFGEIVASLNPFGSE